VPSSGEWNNRLTLVLGGARSGKSAVGERLAAAHGNPVTYVATSVFDAADVDFASRVDAHRARRPSGWHTVECGSDLVNVLTSIEGLAIVDSLGGWVTATPELDVDIAGLCAALSARTAPTVVVSEEVGLGVHPPTAVGIRFRDVVGDVNRAVADQADDVYFVVAGRVVPLQPA
jgi:adenosyl cobinamide kinase/adenosyl cobinamide phosphate guanylyltransferase